MQLVSISVVACETNTNEIRNLIENCTVRKISGTVNTKYRDYSAEDILLNLYEENINNVQRAEQLNDDGASMLDIELIVPNNQKEKIQQFIHQTDADAQWLVQIGDRVDVETKDGILNIEFTGNVIGFKDNFIQVEDMDGDVFDVELEDITVGYVPHSID